MPGLHPQVSAAAGALLEDGHLSQAVFEAFKAVEARVQQLTDRAESGHALMASAFDEKGPLLDIASTTGRNAKDEQTGFRFLFMGAITGVRNPRGHGETPVDSRDEALECLTLASLLMRRLDLAEKKRIDAAIETFERSGSFREAERNMEELILPSASSMEPEQVHRVLGAIVKNRQIRQAIGTRRLSVELFDRTFRAFTNCLTEWNLVCQRLRETEGADSYPDLCRRVESELPF